MTNSSGVAGSKTLRNPQAECPGCQEMFAGPGVMDAENGQWYCSEDCHDNASERYWTAVWTA